MKIPIRIRLTAVYCAVFCVSTGLLEFGAWVGLRSAIDAVVDAELQTRLGGVEEFLDDHVTRVSMARLQSELASHTVLQPGYLEIDDAGGRPIFRAPSMTPFTGARRPVNRR